MDCCQEVCGELVVPRSDPPEVLQPSEHALDGIAPAVEDRAEAGFPAPVALGRDVGRRVPRLDGRAHRVGVVAAIRQDQRASRHQVQQQFGGSAIGRLTTRQRKGEWSSEIVGEGVELGVPTASADADCLRPLPPFPPVAQR